MRMTDPRRLIGSKACWATALVVTSIFALGNLMWLPAGTRSLPPEEVGRRNPRPRADQAVHREKWATFERGQLFQEGETPLTRLREGRVRPQLSADWDGGYGWAFFKYHPSTWELQWGKAAKSLESNETGLCGLMRSQFASEFDRYMKELPRMTVVLNSTAPTRLATEPRVFDDDIFSRFEYRYQCLYPPCVAPPPASGPEVGTTKFTYIEPLVGILRHPGICLNSTIYVLNKDYMILDRWAMLHSRRTNLSPDPSVLFLDAGASLWDVGAGGASQGWFQAAYAQLGLLITDWYMWEAHQHIPSNVFSRIPGHHRPGYRWFNVPLSTDPASWDNPINHLLMEASPEDAVIFKIDFDTPVVEETLVQSIIAHPEVSSLVDELFFEHHVNTEIMRAHWGTRNFTIYQSDSIRLFSQLRNRGVRAHSWV